MTETPARAADCRRRSTTPVDRASASDGRVRTDGGSEASRYVDDRRPAPFGGNYARGSTHACRAAPVGSSRHRQRRAFVSVIGRRAPTVPVRASSTDQQREIQRHSN